MTGNYDFHSLLVMEYACIHHFSMRTRRLRVLVYAALEDESDESGGQAVRIAEKIIHVIS